MIGVALHFAESALQVAADLSLTWISKPLASGARWCRARLDTRKALDRSKHRKILDL